MSYVVEFITRAPKAVDAGVKPADWSFQSAIELPGSESGVAVPELMELWGEAVVGNLIVAQYKIAYQSTVRRMAEAGKADDEITAVMANWKPGDTVSLGDANPLDKAANKFKSMSREEQAQYMAMLQQMIRDEAAAMEE